MARGVRVPSVMKSLPTSPLTTGLLATGLVLALTTGSSAASQTTSAAGPGAPAPPAGPGSAPASPDPVVLFSGVPGGVGDVQVVQFSRPDVTDAAFIKTAGDELYQVVKTQEVPRMVIDLENVKFLSSSTLGMFIALHKVVSKRGGQLRLSNVDPNVRDVFKITKLHKLIGIHDTTDEAVLDAKK